ncbi:hypothetical protein AQ505_25400 [Pedobacter sp. PACM 27299]|uniref:glycosyltransferase n=1 Tax=Pedobacter sp. PACM 27299 TaxID=1727164 RepID=UPI000705BDBF|nr:glycosyltransferase [Pedobacter sp. PACM 27299]ALL08513.1 hypothetical protein AQ505_25400 [Pedobacter sp. PACM 27299]
MVSLLLVELPGLIMLNSIYSPWDALKIFAEQLIVCENTSDLQELLYYYKTIDIFLAASAIGENFGMVIAEAMNSGTPVVTIRTEDRDYAPPLYFRGH